MDQHLKKGLLPVVREERDFLPPWLQALVIKVDVHIPQVFILRELKGPDKYKLTDIYDNIQRTR